MLRDVFYYGNKPNVHPREKFATNLDDARSQATTEHFWVINEYCDYRGFDWDFDFEFLPDEDVWAEEHNNVWPSQHQKDSGTWLCSTDNVNALTIYRADVDPLKRKNEKNSNWVALDLIDDSKFDYSWHPDPTDPPYIYKWGCAFFPVEIKPCLEYHVPGATQFKYMNTTVDLLPEPDRWVEHQEIDKSYFDLSWRPSPLDPPFIYVWGNKYIPGELEPTLEYHAPGATTRKYMSTLLKVLPQWDKWTEVQEVDKKSFDFSWRPDPREPAYIYTWGNKYIDATLRPTLEYHCEGATERKYMTNDVQVLPEWDKWDILQPVNKTTFDFAWRPDPREPDLNYVFGNDQYDSTKMPTVVYRMNNAIDEKHMPSSAKLLPQPTRFEHLEDSNGIDYSWTPDPTSPPYIYAWGNQWNKPEDKVSIQYVVEGATEYKYMEARATRKHSMMNWVIPDNLDISGFDFSWEPSPKDEPFIYQFGTQWQKTGGPRYVVEGATEIKYVDVTKAKSIPNKNHWVVSEDLEISEFDFSWHHDDTEEPFIYVFGNTQYPAEKMATISYVVEGATRIKYVSDIVAKLKPNMKNWYLPENIDIRAFDFSWIPDPNDPPLVYQFGTQWQRTGGPRYIVPNADGIKYVDTQKARALPAKENWITTYDVTVSEFDYSWHPDDTEEPYIYVFGNNQYPAEKMPTLRYVVPGAERTKYIHDVVAKLGVNMKKWQVPSDIDLSSFDFSWIPDPDEPAYIYVFGTQWQKTGGPKYTVQGATEVKYVDTKAKRLPSRKNWIVPENIDESSIDFSWHPDDTEEPFIYHFGTQWNNRGGPEYVVPGATEYKYASNIVGKTMPTKKGWKSLLDIEQDKFDYSWVPHPEAPPYIYVFGNQWNVAELEPTIEYTVEGATEKKYVHDIVATVAQRKEGWTNIESVESFDYSWRPNPTDPAYIYVFGNKQYSGNIMPTVTLTIDGATQEKFVDDIVATLTQDSSNFTDTELISKFDYSWRPNPKDPPYIYQFGTQWAKTHGPKYIVEGATETKYIDDVVATIMPDMTYWEIPDNVDISKFDFSWHPDATAPKYIYQFGTLVDNTDGPRYVLPDNNGEVVYLERTEINIEDIVFPKYYIKTTLEDLIKEHKNEIFWALRTNINYDKFDFNWVPNEENVYHINAFGSPDSETTQTYFVNGKMIQRGYTDINFIENIKLDEEYLATLFKPVAMFYVDRGNKESQERFDKIKERFPDIQKTRYLNTWVDTISRCINRSTTDLCWILNSELDYTDFDFNYYPNPWQMKMVHVFGTQWSHWGTTFMVNRENFAEDTKYIKVIEHLSNLNFVKNRRAKATNVLYDVIYIDHGNLGFTPGASVIKYEESYLNTFKNLLATLPVKKEHYVWICSTICDYDGFDFTYICDPFAREQLHVFPSDKQKFGDTFLINVNKLRELIVDMEKLEDYVKINFNGHQRVKRLPAPTFVTEGDTHVSTIQTDFNWPYATFVTQDNNDIQVIDAEPMNLWSQESKTIQITSTGGTRIVVPREAKDYFKRELYDYPYINTNSRLAKSNPLDIVFLSNGETGADENYEHLLNVTKGLPNRVVRVDGVNGRVQAYHAAADASNTPWMFTVFAKLKVSRKFDWNWQPDRLQIPKHYVFYAENPVTGLVYGHQAMIAYNKKLTLANTGKGLDFTMDDEHEIVETLSGVAQFNTDAWSTWRTAFREAIKLCADNTEISRERLKAWLVRAQGDFAQYSIDGARHAVEYYEEVNHDVDKLKLSYEWAWLRGYYEKKYP